MHNEIKEMQSQSHRKLLIKNIDFSLIIFNLMAIALAQNVMVPLIYFYYFHRQRSSYRKI